MSVGGYIAGPNDEPVNRGGEQAGVLDELVIHQIPVLFGRGRRQSEVRELVTL